MQITEILNLWAKWQNNRNLRLGYPSKSLAIASGGLNCWDDLAEDVDGWMCGECEAAINDLQPEQFAAIHHNYLHAVYKFPRNDYPHILAGALNDLLVRLRRRGVVVENMLDNQQANN